MSTPSVCFGCKETIQGKIVIALEKEWHPEHFVCNNCKKTIESSTFTTKEGKAFCDACYAVLYLPKCASCDEYVRGKVVKAQDKCWHEEHWQCTGCRKPLGSSSFMEQEGKAYCIPCNTRLFAPICSGCHEPVAGKVVMALETKWHPECFKCEKCSKPIPTDAKYKVNAGKPYCSKCIK